MTIFLRSYSTKVGARNRKSGDSAYIEVEDEIRSVFGEAPPRYREGRLDLVLCGLAFKHITGVASLTPSTIISRRDVADLWWQTWQYAAFSPGRGYPEWVWASTFHFLRTAWQTSRAMRVEM